MSFDALFRPRAVAVFGSVSPGKLGGILIDQLLAGGFSRVYAINPKAQSAEGVSAYASIFDAPNDVDLAVVATPADTVAAILENCGKRRIRAAVVISSGFSEAGNAAGEAELVDIARRYGIRFIGPNCAGLSNTHHALQATIQAQAPKGGTAIVSQSGAVGGAILELANLHGLGVSKFVSYGNGADLNQTEFLRYLADDPETANVVIYIENVQDGAAFRAALSQLAAKKPVVVLKAGRTMSGQRAALSHTGSLAGSDRVFDAVFAECGAVRVDSLDDVLDLCKGFSYLPPVNGKKIAIVTNSGGPGVMTADLGESLGMDVCAPDAAALEKLKSFLPAWAGYSNPFDLTVEGTGEKYRMALETALRSYDAAVCIFFGPPYLDTRPVAEGILAAFKNSGKPIACAMETGLNAASSARFLQENGLPNFPSTERAMRVLWRMARDEKRRMRPRAEKIALPKTEPIFPGAKRLLEPAAMELLAKNGVASPPFRFIADAADAGAACAALGFPVAMKVVSPKVLHKSDRGGVRLNVGGEAEARRVFCDMAEQFAGDDFRGVIAYPMLSGGHEVMIGVTRDKQFGPIVAFGLGGIYTEVLRDVVLHTAPVTVSEAEGMIRGIRAFPILDGARGQKKADIGALARMIAAVSLLPLRYPDLAEADFNPVFVFPEGQGAVVADVRLL